MKEFDDEYTFEEGEYEELIRRYEGRMSGESDAIEFATKLREQKEGEIEETKLPLANDPSKDKDDEELEKALNKIKEYIKNKKGGIPTLEELPLDSIFIQLRAKVIKHNQIIGYFDVGVDSNKKKTHSFITELDYELERPVNDDKRITITDKKKGITIELYLLKATILNLVTITAKTPETLAKELFEAYDGWGTYDEDALEVLKQIGPRKSNWYNLVNGAYLKLYGRSREKRTILEDTIHEMIDSPEELRKAFSILEYDASERVLSWMKWKSNKTDSLAYAMRSEDMKNFSVNERYKLIKYVATGNVGNQDEDTIIRLLENIPINDIEPFFRKLKADNGELLERLESKMNFSEYSKYHQTLHMLYQLQFFYENTPKEVAQQLEKPKNVFAYRNPSAITNAFKVRNYIDEVEIRDGKVHFEYWTLGPISGYSNHYSFGFFEPITILFLDDEPTFNAKAGERIMMPAINLFALEDAQAMREAKLAVDIALILSGAGGVFSAASKAGKVWAGVEVLMGAADITINELRSEIAETESGREFLKYWDIASTVITVYGIGKAVMQLPDIFRKLGDSYRAYKNLSKLDKKKLGKIDELMEELRLSVKKTKDDARAKITDPNNAAHITARENAWKKYQSKNPDADFEAYKQKYDTLAINREAGVLTEKEFQRLLGGETKNFWPVVNGKKVLRKIDNFLDGVAREIKSGPLKNTEFIRDQISKDIELINQYDLKIEWHLFESPNNQELINFMRSKGITVIEY